MCLWVAVPLIVLAAPTTAASASSASLSVYPFSGAELSEYFTVSVQQQGGTQLASPVYSSSSAQRCNVPTGSFCPNNHTQAFASFWFSGAPVMVTISIRKPGGWGDWSQVAVRPRSSNITVRKINETCLSFLVSPSALGWKLSVESATQMADGYPALVAHSLMLFADPETIAPDNVFQGSETTMYFGPGIHDIGGQIPVPENVTRIYIAGGAWINGGFITTTSKVSVTISGRGVISGSKFSFLKDPAGMGPCIFNGSFCWSLVNLDKGIGHHLEGLVLHDPPKYFFRSYASNVKLRGLKMMGAWTPNSDGVVTGAGGVVTDTFIRSNDDSIKLFASGMVVADTTIWQMTNGGVFQLGWWREHHQRDILVKDITILHADWKVMSESWCHLHPCNDGVFDLGGPGGGTPVPAKGGAYNITNITFQDVTIDAPIAGGGLIRMDLANATGACDHLRFERLSVPAAMPSSVAVSTSTQKIGKFSFFDLKVGGKCAHSASAAAIDPPPEDSTFECSG
jgi:hypothetical protein